MVEPISDLGKSAIDGLKSQPAFMALVVFNVVVLAGMFWLLQAQAERKHKEFNAMLERCHFQQYGGPKT